MTLDVILFVGLAVLYWRRPLLLRNLRVWHGILGAYVCLYWLSCLYAVDLNAALVAAAKLTSLLPLALLTSSLTQGQYNMFIRQWAWAGAFFTIWGWLFGLFRDGRLESTIGYANTLAILLAIGCCVAWQTYQINHRKVYLWLLIIQFIGLVQTGSRTVMVIFVCVSIVGLIQLRGNKLFLWLGVATTSILVLLALVEFYQMPLLQRFVNISWTAPEFELRRVYWNDGINMFKEHWFSGLGGGGWAVEHSSWYYVKYLHQFYLQMALEVGVGGLILFGMLVVIPLYKTRKKMRTVGFSWILITVLLCHVFVDLDFEYPLCYGLFIILLSRIEEESTILL